MTSNNENPTMKTRRKLTWRERETNKLRERKRRAITANIFNTLRTQGNYNLSKNCDTNKVLKALCNEAGWEVEQDGTTYRKGNTKPPLHNDGGTSSGTIPFSYSQNPSLVPPSSSTPIPSYHLTPMHFPSMTMSNSALVTPHISSPTSRNTKSIPIWDSISKKPMAFSDFPFVASSTPGGPKQQDIQTPMKFQHFAQSPSGAVTVHR